MFEELWLPLDIEKFNKDNVFLAGESRGGQRRQRLSLKDGTITEESIENPPMVKSAAKEQRLTLRNNMIAVLRNSTVMPFRWLKSSYRCFYCYDIFQEVGELKDHQQKHEGIEVISQTVNNYWEPALYVDVSNMACKLCEDIVTDINELIDHLISKHGIEYNKDYSCIVPFRLESLSVICVTCGVKFYTFGPLLLHTNKEHKGVAPILCDVCGQHCRDANLLKVHMKTVHENSGLLCTECGEKFETRSKLKTHQKNQHSIDKKFKCMVCAEMFQSQYKRARHMAAEHKNRQEVKCLHCPKTFVFRSMMMAHVRHTHLKVRNHVCGVCGWKAFNSYRLNNHMFKHSGEKNFKCDACDKAFTTKKIMRAHHARMHKNATAAVPFNSYAAN